jgi:hypothetical protein
LRSGTKPIPLDYTRLVIESDYRKFGVGKHKEIAGERNNVRFLARTSCQGGEFFFDQRDPTHTHATARFGNQALEFLDESSAEIPFCLSISFKRCPCARWQGARI